jgi:hypothetical protein
MANSAALTNAEGGFMQELGQIAQKLQLPLAQTDDLVQSVANDILRSMWRYPEFKKGADGLDEEIPLSEEDKAFNVRINNVHKQWNDGIEFPQFRRHKIRGVGLAGPPGHGKTSTIEAAAKRVARAMNMRYLSPDRLESVPLSEIDGNTFAFVSEETAGLVSAMEMFGMPAEGRTTGVKDEEGNDVRFLARLFSLPLQKLMRAGGGVLLFDDFSNAIKQIQDTGLSLMDRRRNGELVLTKTYFAATGNLGGLDDTNATRMSSALRGRMRTYLTHDTVDNFLARNLADPLLQDSLGDVFVRAFFKRTKDKHFSRIPAKGEQGGYPSPRTWRDAIDDLRDCLHRHGGRSIDAIEAARYEINSILQASVGLVTAQAFNAFLESVLVGAEPLAAQLISTGEIDQAAKAKHFSPEGFSSNDQFFAHQFVVALADHTVNRILADPSKFEETIQRFGRGLEEVKEQGNTFELGLEELQARLLVQVPEVMLGRSKKLVISKVVNAEQNRREMTVEAGTKIGDIIMGAIPVDTARRDVIKRVFSDMNKMDDRVDQPTPGRSR